MKYSIRTLIWVTMAVALGIYLSSKISEERGWATAHVQLPKTQSNLEAQLRAYRNELDELLGKGWTLERDDNGKLLVQPGSSYRPKPAVDSSDQTP